MNLRTQCIVLCFVSFLVSGALPAQDKEAHRSQSKSMHEGADANRKVLVERSNGEVVRTSSLEFEGDRVKFAEADKYETIPLVELESISFEGDAVAPLPAPLTIYLKDGTKFGAKTFTIQGGLAHIELLNGGSIEVKSSFLDRVSLKTLTPDYDGDLKEILANNKKTDRIIVHKPGVLDPSDGIIEKVTPTHVRFDLEGESIDVPREKLAAIIFNRFEPPETPRTLGHLKTKEGDTIAFSQINSSTEKLEIKTPGGTKLEIPTSSVQGIDLGTANSVTLSSLSPTEETVKSYFDIPDGGHKALMPKRGPVKVDGKTYANGLSLRSHTTLVYRIDEPASLFTALAAIDDSVKDVGQVQLTIKGKAKGSEETVLFDKRIDGKKPPQAIQLAMKGIKRLTIEVSWGDGSDIGDLLNLINARLVK